MNLLQASLHRNLKRQQRKTEETEEELRKIKEEHQAAIKRTEQMEKDKHLANSEANAQVSRIIKKGKKRKKIFKAEIDVKVRRIADLETQLGAVNAELATVAEQKRAEEVENRKLNSSNQELRSTIQPLKIDNERLKSQQAAAHVEKRHLQATLEAMRVKLRTAEQEKDQLQIMLEARRKKQKATEQEREKLQVALESTQERLNTAKRVLFSDMQLPPTPEDDGPPPSPGEMSPVSNSSSVLSICYG